MAVFNLKRGNTRPILQVELRNPDGTAFDHAGATAYKLNIWRSDGVKLIRNLVPFGDPPAGGQPDTRPLRYAWLLTDWGAVNGDGTAGGLVISPTLPLTPGVREHLMDYDVIGGSSRITFPSGGNTPAEAYDVLRIWDSIGP